MSIHAQISEEAQARLRAQKRNSTISSIVVSLLVVAVIFLVLGIFLLPSIIKETPTISVQYSASTSEEAEVKEQPKSKQIEKKPAAPAAAISRVITSNTASATSIPVPDVDFSAPSVDFGDAQDFGVGWGDAGLAAGGEFGKIPSSMRERCSPEDRMKRLLESGGTKNGEKAVVKALDWLKDTQNEDGSWDNQHPIAMTGFALLAFLGHCETPLSEKYGEEVLKAITYLVNNGMKNEGKLTNKPDNSIQWVYDHGIAAYALAESYTFCSRMDINVPDLDTVVKKAIDMIIDGQSDNGGWVYRFARNGAGDNSVGFWQIQALKASKHTDLFKDSELKSASRKALEWLESVQGANGAIGYRNSSTKSPGLTGGGVLAFQIWGEGDSKAAKKGIEYLSENSEFEWGSANANFYYHYYNAQALINHGGKEWDTYNDQFREELIKNQKADGSWDRGAGGNHGAINVHMATCLATMMLEVYYRFLPGSE